MKNILGVLGGMGPQATVRFYDLAIEKSRAMGACKNCDFPHMVISNAPVPDFISGRKDEEVAVGMIEQEIVRLENAGADFLVITCNTMHLHMERFRAKGSVPILSMIDAVVDKIKGLRAFVWVNSSDILLHDQSFGHMQVRTLSRRYASSRRP